MVYDGCGDGGGGGDLDDVLQWNTNSSVVMMILGVDDCDT
jgi:hypothetical protein